MKNKQKIFLTIPLICSLLGCSSSQYKHNPNETVRAVTVSRNLKVAQVTESGQPAFRDPIRADKFDAKCRLASMPGYLYGYTRPPVFMHFEIKQHEVTLNLDPKYFDTYLQIATLKKSTIDFPHSLETNPPDVKFARIGTICDGIFVGLASEKAEPMMLVYFDQKVHLKGIIGAADNAEIVDLQIPERGFYYLIAEPLEKQKKRITRFYSGGNAFIAVSTKRL